MTRKEFIKICGILGISLPFQQALALSNTTTSNAFKGKVLIIGAGAAGLAAAYHLHQQGIDFQIVEASSTYGGRLKTTTDFVDFPIPLGAEWLHGEREIFDEIINDTNVTVTIKTTPYDEDEDYGLYEGEEYTIEQMKLDGDQKFIGATWLNFFEEYILPSVQDNIMYNKVVKAIDYTGDKILVETATERFEADKIIITVPVKMLQKKSIVFTPQLPKNKLEAIESISVWDGLKVFIEFSETFYPVAVESKVSGQKMYYDAAYGQNSKHHVLGLFVVGPAANYYQQLSDDELIQNILEELDEMSDGKASSKYIQHISQNWSKEPFIEGAYVANHERWRRIRTLGQSIDGKVFFAGTAYTTGDDWGGVHAAIHSAIRSVDEILA